MAVVDPHVVNQIRQLLDAVTAEQREQIMQNLTNPQPGFRHPVFDAIGRLLEQTAPELRAQILREAAPPVVPATPGRAPAPGTPPGIVDLGNGTHAYWDGKYLLPVSAAPPGTPMPGGASATPPATPSPGGPPPTPPSGGPPPPPPGGGPPNTNQWPPPNETNPGPNPTPVPAAPVPATQDVYDWHRVNEALVAGGLNNWQISGQNHIPVNQGKWVKNPLYDVYKDASPKELADAGITEMPTEFTWQESGEYVIGVHNPATNQMLKLTLTKGARDPVTGGYTYSVIGRTDQGTIEQNNPGYKDLQRLPFQDGHQEIWGTNTQTGAFERLPTQPTGLGSDDPKTKGWNDIRQIEQADGSMVWVGTPPAGGDLQVIPGMPVLKGSGQHENIRQVTKNGKQVYVGFNKQTQQWEDIAELGATVVPPTTTTVGGTVYKPNPNAGQPGQPDFVQVTGVSQPNEGDPQWVDAGGGYVKQQIYRSGAWQDTTEAWKPVSPATVRAEGAIRPAGTPYEVPMTVNGTTRLVTVTADGNGGYTIPKDTTSRPFPGAPIDKAITPTAAEQEFISRYNPETGQQENVRNPNWSPEATGDRVRMLRELAATKQQELTARIGKNGYTAEQAQKDFDTYWDTQIEPRRQQLQFDQEQERRKAETEAQTARQTALTTAAALGQNAVENYTTQQKNMVGPGYAQQSREMFDAIREGRAPTINPEAYQYQGYDLNELAQYHTARALQHISPSAAGLLGGQPTLPQATQGMDLNSLLNRTAFQPQGAPPQGGVTINVNAGGATTTTPTPPVTGGVDPAAAARAALAAAPFNAFGPTAIDDPYGRTNALV